MYHGPAEAILFFVEFVAKLPLLVSRIIFDQGKIEMYVVVRLAITFTKVLSKNIQEKLLQPFITNKKHVYIF